GGFSYALERFRDLQPLRQAEAGVAGPEETPDFTPKVRDSLGRSWIPPPPPVPFAGFHRTESPCSTVSRLLDHFTLDEDFLEAGAESPSLAVARRRQGSQA